LGVVEKEEIDVVLAIALGAQVLQTPERHNHPSTAQQKMC